MGRYEGEGKCEKDDAVGDKAQGVRELEVGEASWRFYPRESSPPPPASLLRQKYVNVFMIFELNRVLQA